MSSVDKFGAAVRAREHAEEAQADAALFARRFDAAEYLLARLSVAATVAEAIETVRLTCQFMLMLGAKDLKKAGVSDVETREVMYLYRIATAFKHATYRGESSGRVWSLPMPYLGGERAYPEPEPEEAEEKKLWRKEREEAAERREFTRQWLPIDELRKVEYLGPSAADGAVAAKSSFPDAPATAEEEFDALAVMLEVYQSELSVKGYEQLSVAFLTHANSRLLPLLARVARSGVLARAAVEAAGSG